MWDNITPDSFRYVKDIITSHHATLGGVLCGLAVKMARWQEKFADGRGGPMQRAEFLMSEMRQGIEKSRILKNLPQLSLKNEPSFFVFVLLCEFFSGPSGCYKTCYGYVK